jgi:hypothetical protein
MDIERDMLWAAADPALDPLFKAHRALSEQARDFLASLSHIKDPPLAEVVRLTSIEDLHVVSGCIVIIGDNICKHYASKVLGDRNLRGEFGNHVGNTTIPFGRALREGANAFRHFEDWMSGESEPRQMTKATLEKLGVPWPFESACVDILREARAETKQGFWAELDCMFAQIDAAPPTTPNV